MAGDQLAIATFNLKNLNLPGRRIHRDADGLDEATYDAKIAWTANAIRDLQADIVGFQELWHPDALARTFEVSGLSSQYDLATKPGHDGGSIQNALAVRSPHRILRAEWIASFPDRFVMRVGGQSAADTDYTLDVRIRQFSRPVLHAVVDVVHGGATIAVDVYVIHLKSKLATGIDHADRASLLAGDGAAVGSALSTIRRTAEATALRMLINGRISDQGDDPGPIAVVGDFNDGQLSTTAAVVSEEPAYRLYDASRVGGQSTRGLYAAATLQQLRSLRDVYFTHIHEGTHESLDHILVSQHFYDHSRRRIWSFRRMRVLNDELDSESEAATVPHSDHAPVVALYDYRG